MKIRKAVVGDLKRILELNLMLFEKEHGDYDKLLDLNWTFGKKGRKYFRDALTKSSSCVFVAEYEGVVVGYLSGGMSTGEEYRKLPKMVELGSLFVLEEYRSNGVGKKLYDEFMKWAKGKGFKRMKVEADPRNKKGVLFYEKMGLEGFTVILEREI